MKRANKVPAFAALGVGVVVIVVGLVAGQTSAALGALAASWLCFTGVGAGALAFSAAVRISRGRWASQALPAAEAAGGFLWPAVAILTGLLLTARTWIPGLGEEPASAWMSLMARDLAGGVALAAVAGRYVAALRSGALSAKGFAAAYLLTYVGVMSLWAVDLIMGLSNWAPSTVIPPMYFMGAFLSGIAWTSLNVAAQGAAAEYGATRHDLGRLLFAFCIFWGYLAWAAYLPTWYGNLPEETGQLMLRWDGGWKFLTIPVIALVFVIPFFLLLPEGGKRGFRSLAAGAVIILVGLVGERFLMVLPSLATQIGGWTVLMMLGTTGFMLGAFLLFARARSWGASGLGDLPVD